MEKKANWYIIFGGVIIILLALGGYWIFKDKDDLAKDLVPPPAPPVPPTPPNPPTPNPKATAEHLNATIPKDIKNTLNLGVTTVNGTIVEKV
jgi:hypothetical protein